MLSSDRGHICSARLAVQAATEGLLVARLRLRPDSCVPPITLNCPGVTTCSQTWRLPGGARTSRMQCKCGCAHTSRRCGFQNICWARPCATQVGAFAKCLCQVCSSSLIHAHDAHHDLHIPLTACEHGGTAPPAGPPPASALPWHRGQHSARSAAKEHGGGGGQAGGGQRPGSDAPHSSPTTGAMLPIVRQLGQVTLMTPHPVTG